MEKRKPPRFDGEALKGFRAESGLSRMDLAREIGFLVGPSTIRRYEIGQGTPTIAVALKLAAAVDCEVEDLITDG